MARIVIAGNVNVETTAQIAGFPLPYAPVTYAPGGIGSRVGGVGYNLALALRTLGNDVALASLVGRDLAGSAVRDALALHGIAGKRVLDRAAATPQSVVLYDAAGRRAIITDLKDAPTLEYPALDFEQALPGADLAVLTNIGYARPLLTVAQRAGVPIATDLHTITDLDDAYNQPWLAAAAILAMSGEQLPEPPARWADRIFGRYPARLVVFGLGADGALLVERGGAPTHVPAVTTRPLRSTVGAGDALFAAFLHAYLHGSTPTAALRSAVVFASYKIGAAGAAEGFLDASGLSALVARVYGA